MEKIPARFSKTSCKTEISLTRLAHSHMNTLNIIKICSKQRLTGLREETLNTVDVYVKLTSLVIFVSSTDVNKPFYSLLGLSTEDTVGYCIKITPTLPPPPSTVLRDNFQNVFF